LHREKVRDLLFKLFVAIILLKTKNIYKLKTKVDISAMGDRS